MKWDPRNLFRGRSAADAVSVADEDEQFEDIVPNRAQRRALAKRQNRAIGQLRVVAYERAAKQEAKRESAMKRVLRISDERAAFLRAREEAKVRAAAEEHARSLIVDEKFPDQYDRTDSSMEYEEDQ